MNWLIRSTKYMLNHTYLDAIVEPIKDEIDNYNWLICDIEIHSAVDVREVIDVEADYFILSPAEFRKLLDKHVQLRWAVVLAIPINTTINVGEHKLPYIDGNALIWKNGNLQLPDAEIEIDCFDSTCTIIKFTDQQLSNRFKTYFGNNAEQLVC
jgi:hypothetical protein